jgi:hypothetical protein
MAGTVSVGPVSLESMPVVSQARHRLNFLLGDVMYIKRNSQRDIVAVSLTAEPGFDETLADDAPEVQAFLTRFQSQPPKGLAESDLEMVRVLEDLVSLLIERNVIRFTDLPTAAQTKLLSRRELRGQHQGINLLSDEDNISL